MQVDLMISPVADHEGWRVVAIHDHSQAQKIAHRRATNGTRSAMGAAAILAHEIKNPLYGIRGAAQLLRSEERRVGKECVRTCSARRSPDHYNYNTSRHYYSRHFLS